MYATDVKDDAVVAPMPNGMVFVVASPVVTEEKLVE